MPALAISVVIPVFDGERFLAEAVESALAQSLPPAEVVVVDDGSSDGSAAVAESFGPPVRVIRTPNRGVSAARNTGVAESTGELIAFLDADDLMKPDRLERQVAALAEQPGAELVMGRDEIQAEDGVEMPTFVTGKPAPLNDGIVPYYAMSLLTTRAAFERVGPFDEELRLAEDADWLMRAFEAGVEPVLIEEPLIVRRFHGGNASYQTAAARRTPFEVLRRRAARHRAAADGAESG